MNADSYPDAMSTDTTADTAPAAPSVWAKLRLRRTRGEMIATIPLLLGVRLLGGDLSWVLSALVVAGFLLWTLARPMPPAETRGPTPDQNRQATKARMAEGAERDRRQRVEREAEYGREAEQRRREGAARREAEAAAG